MGTLRIVLPSVVCLAVPYFSTVSYKRHVFGKVYWTEKRVLIFSTNIVWNISRSKKNSARYYHKCTYVFMWSAVILVRFEWNLNFLDRFSKNTQILNFMKIRPVEAELFHVDRRTDGHDEAGSRFWKFCERAWKLLSLRQFLAKWQFLSKFLWSCPALMCINLGSKLHKIRAKFNLRCCVKYGLCHMIFR